MPFFFAPCGAKLRKTAHSATNPEEGAQTCRRCRRRLSQKRSAVCWYAALSPNRRSLAGGAAPPWLRRSVPSRTKPGARGAVVIIMINAVPNNDGSEAASATGGGELPAFGDIWAPGACARMCAPSCHPAVAALSLPRYASAEKTFRQASGEPIGGVGRRIQRRDLGH